MENREGIQEQKSFRIATLRFLCSYLLKEHSSPPAGSNIAENGAQWGSVFRYSSENSGETLVSPIIFWSLPRKLADSYRSFCNCFLLWLLWEVNLIESYISCLILSLSTHFRNIKCEREEVYTKYLPKWRRSKLGQPQTFGTAFKWMIQTSYKSLCARGTMKLVLIFWLRRSIPQKSQQLAVVLKCIVSAAVAANKMCPIDRERAWVSKRRGRRQEPLAAGQTEQEPLKRASARLHPPNIFR